MVKTSIIIDDDLWKKFGMLVVEERGYRKKKEVIEELIREYVREKSRDATIDKAIILGAGLGSRLRPLTENKPKCLLKVDSKTILEHEIEKLKKCGIDDITIVLGYGSDKIVEFFENRSWSVDFVLNEKFTETNNLYSLWMAREKFNDGFVCLNSDIIFDFSILDNLLSCDDDVCIAVKRKQCVEEDMKVILGPNKEVVRTGKEISPNEAHGEFLGMIKFGEGGVNYLDSLFDDLSSDELKNMFLGVGVQRLTEYGKISALEIDDVNWFDVDYVEDLMEVRQAIL